MGKVQVETDIPQVVNYVATTVTVGNTTILAPGQPASVTNSGTPQNAILNFGIPSTSADFQEYRKAADQDIIDATKQPKTLSTAITVNGVSKTTVEDALNAINENTAIANTSLSNLDSTGENHFVQLQSGVSQSNVDYVIESYSSGTSWYKVWKSGWCEEGGWQAASGQVTSVTFLKTYSATPNILFSNTATGGSGGTQSTQSIVNASTSGFEIHVPDMRFTGYYWRACGYLSSGE